MEKLILLDVVLQLIGNNSSDEANCMMKQNGDIPVTSAAPEYQQ
ncbi:unnamed protein product, partial [Cercopithifilaria johnstoni]